MKIILAIDSFKGCLTSEEVEAVFARALTRKGARVQALPMSDGGEGMLGAFVSALHGHTVELSVHDPMMRPVNASYGITPRGTAIIETALACGLTLMAPHERNPLVASSYGVGELVADALKRGCRRFIVGLGGSGTSDAGTGMLRALTHLLAPQTGLTPPETSRAENRRQELLTPPETSATERLPIIPEVLERYARECSFVLASDVRNPLCGPHGAAHTFAPQKGATPQMVDELDRRAERFARLSAQAMGNDCSHMPGAGAAGGLGYAFMQYLGARAESGADLLLHLTGFDRLIEGADLIITGEGHADRQTLMGKLPERVLRRAERQGIPVWLVAGRVSHTQELIRAGFARVEGITPDGTDIREAILPPTAEKNIAAWVERNFTPPQEEPV